MSNDEKRVILIHLVKKLNEAESWSGETHIQKAVYFLSNLKGIDLGFPFILYRYGPYSFELRNELIYLEAIGILERKESPPYGSHFSLGEHASSFESYVSINTQEIEETLNEIVVTFFTSNDNVSELERDATALYALKNFPGDQNERAKLINTIKPHISIDKALLAIKRVSEMME